MRFILFFFLGLLVLASAATPTDRNMTERTSVAFVGVNVIPMDSPRVLTDQTVLVRGDRIVQLSPKDQVRAPAEALVVEASGKYLMPGVAEMHGHVPEAGGPASFTESVLFLYLAHGVTTVRGMKGSTGQLALRERVNRGEVLAPTFYLAGPGLGDWIRTPAEAEQRVREEKAAGWDLLKVHPGLPREAYDAMARTAREVRMRFGGHIPAEVGLLHALEQGQETIEHMDRYLEYLDGYKKPVDQKDLDAVARRTRAAGASVVPTMSVVEAVLGLVPLEVLKGYPELKYMPAETVKEWTDLFERRIYPTLPARAVREQAQANRMRLLKALHDNGVKILFGTDSPQLFNVPGFSIHREMQLMAEAGLTPYEILRSATALAGEYFKDRDTFGTIAVGSRADMILLEKNPLKDVSNLADPLGVMARGRWLTKRAIREKLVGLPSQGERKTNE